VAYSTPPAFTAGQILTEAQLDTLSDDIAFLANPPKVRLRATAAQNIATGSITAINFAVEDYDTQGLHSTSSNTSRITIVTAGTYTFKGGVLFGSSAGGTYRYVDFLKNGVSLHGGIKVPPVADCSLIISVDLALSAGDYVQFRAGQDTGADLSVNDASHQRTFFSARWVSL
jgi:hypothetical protein